MSKASGIIAEIRQQYDLPEEDISENTAVMGLVGQNSNESMKNIYRIAAVLFVLVLLAGILMISGSMNSNVAQRTKFFGMMRCIGASRQQIIRYVRLENMRLKFPRCNGFRKFGYGAFCMSYNKTEDQKG